MYAGSEYNRGGSRREKWALEKVLAYYADYIEELATVEIEQPDGSVKKVVDEDFETADRAEAAGRDTEFPAGGSKEGSGEGMKRQIGIEQNRYATALAGHRAAILFNPNF